MKRIKIDIEVNYGSEFQKIVFNGQLILFLETLLSYFNNNHKKNKMNIYLEGKNIGEKK